MRRALTASALTAALAFASMGVDVQAAHADTDTRVVASCGSITYNVGESRPDTMDTTGVKCVGTGTLGPSGFTPVAISLTSATQSAAATPTSGRQMYLTLVGTAVATCSLQRKLDGTNWTNWTSSAGGTTTQLYTYTFSGAYAQSEDIPVYQAGTQFRLNCTSYTSGTVAGTFTQ